MYQRLVSAPAQHSAGQHIRPMHALPGLCLLANKEAGHANAGIPSVRVKRHGHAHPDHNNCWQLQRQAVETGYTVLTVLASV